MLLKTGFIVLSLLVTFFLIYIGFKTIERTFRDKKKVQKKKMYLLLGFIVWHIYNYSMGSSGILENYNLPPRLAIFIIIPIFIFIGIFIYRNKRQLWLQNINPKVLVYFQTFRILVETLFVFSLAENILHRNTTIEGYNFDMLFAITAPLVGFFVFRKETFSTKIIIAWNLLGLAVLASVVFVFITTVYFPEFYGSTVALMPTKFASYPFVLIAGLLMPSAVFVHILSIAQLLNRPK